MIKDSILEFVNQWPSEKKLAESKLQNNKLSNAILKTDLETRGRSHQYEKLKSTFPIGELSTSKLIRRQIPDLFMQLAKLPDSKYLISGSVGKGKLVDIPWICIFDKDITTSAQDGYYIVYLFDAKLEGIYLCLGQGWTQYENSFGIKQGKIEISKNVKTAQNMLRSTHGFNKTSINLLSNGRLAKGYEAGVMLNKYYLMTELPDDIELVDDLRNLIGVYKELKGLVGNKIIDIVGITDEVTFQEEIQKPQSKKTPKGKLTPKDKIGGIETSRRPRSAIASFEALETSGYKCENEHTHETFISAKSGHQFVEAHHLIPIEFQDDFEFSIDVPENIISLCPNCHRIFHNAESMVKYEIVKKFFEKRRKLLAHERGINIDKEQLLAYYCKNN